MFQYRRILLPIIVLFSAVYGYSQIQPIWDNTLSGDWPREFNVITIKSTLDQNLQPAIAYFTKDSDPKPLIVSLHTWSGGYDQKDPLAAQCLERGYNYIHPHFRGPNNTFDACGSEKVIQDIDDAITFAIQNGNIDTTQIHIIGVSGGGYATLIMYMKTKHNIKTFSAWAPISNLIDWYGESEARKNKYGKDIATATTGLEFGKQYYIDTVEAKKRSPIFMKTPVGQRKNSKLFLYTGIHDGYTGSVPITHTLFFYNKIARSLDPINADLVSEEDIITMLASRSFNNPGLEFIDDRKIQYQINHKGLIQLTIFEGSHELLEQVALDHIDSNKILAIGDSNGAMKDGWVDLLQNLRFSDFIYNSSIAGNTIGFDNLGNKALNSTRNIEKTIELSSLVMGGTDVIVIMLGTNDCKAIFQDSITDALLNLRCLIRKIKIHTTFAENNPLIILVSPPPIGENDYIAAKYHGAADRLVFLRSNFKKIAKEEKCIYIDTNKLLSEFDITEITSDGIHLTVKGQYLIAALIDVALDSLMASK